MQNNQWIGLVLLFLLLGACSVDNNDKKEESPNFLWEEIKKEGKIIAITEYSSTEHFIYKGSAMGFQYELLQRLSDFLNLEIEIVLNQNLEESFVLLNKHECHLMAMNLAITDERQEFVDFTYPLVQTSQVLVQRKPNGWEHMSDQEYDFHCVRSLKDLASKEIYIRSNSSYAERLAIISKDIGQNIEVKELLAYSDEQIIDMVANGDVDYTISDKNIAVVNTNYHSNIDVSTDVSSIENIAWAIPKNADSLRYYLNLFIKNSISQKWYVNLFRKYYKNRRFSSMYKSKYLSLNSDNISQYDELIKKYAKELGWDWRLLASLIYQESRFNSNIKSRFGAMGLMQLMPATAKKYGITEESSPSENIRAGVTFLSWLDNQLKKYVTDSIERVNFVLASYNVGMGHVLDAMRLASFYDKDSTLWNNNVDYFMRKKSDPKFYTLPVVKYGYCRGYEPSKYVSEVMHRYREYYLFME